MKRRVVRLVGAAVITPVALAALGLASVWVGSEWQLSDVPESPPFSVEIPTDSLSLERGRHIARTRGCFGCHGQSLEGKVFTDEWPWVERAVAPNLARHAREHDADALERAIRQGVGHNGRALWSMPSYNWAHLSDEDVAALIAFLRSAPAVEKELPEGQLGWRARWVIATGKEGHMADWRQSVPDLLLDPTDDPSLVRGEYLAMTACNECHGLDLRGANAQPDIATPDLALVGAYTWEEFNHLMDTGLPRDGRETLGLMTTVARDRFASFTDQEREDLYAFLRTLVQWPVPTDVFWRVPPEGDR